MSRSDRSSPFSVVRRYPTRSRSSTPFSIRRIRSSSAVCSHVSAGRRQAGGYLLPKEEDWVERAGAMIEKARSRALIFLLPVDVVVADAFSEDARTEVVSVDEIPQDMMGLDIGPRTSAAYAAAIENAGSVFWNGPMGVFEMKAFSKPARRRLLKLAVAEAAQADTIIGGGGSVAAVNKFDLADKMTFISTGGGASMELVQGEVLPGVEALRA